MGRSRGMALVFVDVDVDVDIERGRRLGCLHINSGTQYLGGGRRGELCT
jgi:hypothetical protein